MGANRKFSFTPSPSVKARYSGKHVDVGFDVLTAVVMI
jgi:hypothetical protein